MGIGSAVFHPESSRVARMASGGRHGLAQSVFQVGGNIGSSFGPLLGAFLVLPRGQGSIAWCALLALAGIAVLWKIGGWHRAWRQRVLAAPPASASRPRVQVSPRRVGWSLAILGGADLLEVLLSGEPEQLLHVLPDRKVPPVGSDAQIQLFVFLAAVAVGTILGGPIGDRIGRKLVIWVSILGVLPFTLLLPYASLFWTPVLAIVIGLILASAFSAIVVFAQELVPGRVGLISGVFFGFAFGMGGIGAAVLGQMADVVGIEAVYRLCAFLPAIGLLAAFLPDV